jgi:hypothetical protein
MFSISVAIAHTNPANSLAIATMIVPLGLPIRIMLLYFVKINGKILNKIS